MAEKVSVVIPNWNGLHWLPLCLDSLAAQSYRDFQVYVVDNGSTDGSVEWLKTHHPDLDLIENDTNLGFAGGMNCGFRAARGALLVALNNDVEVHPDWLATLIAAMDAHPEVGSGTSQLMDFKDRAVIDSLGDGFLPIGLSFKAGSKQIYPEGGLEVHDIQSPCAAASVYRKSMLDQIGLFDEDFFAYMEDIDLGLRAQRAGYRCIFVPQAIVYHIGSATSGGTASAFSLRHTIKNTYAVIIKNVPGPLVPIYLLLTFIFHVAALIGSLFSRKFDFIARHRTACLQGLWAAVMETPKSLKKRQSLRHFRKQTLTDFVAITKATWKLGQRVSQNIA